MRVLWLSHVVPWPPKTGMLQRSHNLVRQVARRHELHVAALHQRSLLPAAQLGAALAELEALGARVHVEPLPSDASRLRWAALTAASFFRRAPYDVNWRHSRGLARTLEGLGAAQRFDLLHVDTLGMLPYARAFEGAPVVLNHHNVESQMLARRAAREPRLVRRLYFAREAGKLARLEAEACPKVSLNLAVSPLDAERLGEIAPGARIRVVDNGVDVEYFRSTAPPGSVARGIVFAGGMSWYPNREAVLFFLDRIWPALLEDDPDRRVHFVGPDPPPRLRAAARDPRITVTGFVDDVRPYLERAAIYVCPILDGGGTRLKILDALAMAKPLVATALAVEGLGLEEGRHYLRAEKPLEFVAQIKRLEADPELRARLAREGRRRVETHFSWDVMGEKLDAAYREAVGGARA